MFKSPPSRMLLNGTHRAVDMSIAVSPEHGIMTSFALLLTSNDESTLFYYIPRLLFLICILYKVHHTICKENHTQIIDLSIFHCLLLSLRFFQVWFLPLLRELRKSQMGNIKDFFSLLSIAIVVIIL